MQGLDLLNHLANLPEILPHVAPGHEPPINLAPFFEEPRNVMLGDIDGVVLFRYLRPGVYEGHYLLTERRRGKTALKFCRAALNIMFTGVRAEVIFGFTPRQNRAASAISCALGFKPLGPVTIDGLTFAMCVLRREDYEFHKRHNRRGPEIDGRQASGAASADGL